LIKLIALDVDGTMTSGNITYLNNDEIKSFCVKDGMAVAAWNRLGFISAIITGRKSSIVQKRGEELGCKYILQEVWDKGDALRGIIQKEGLKKEEVAAIGDDLNDIKMLKASGLRFAPKNASHLLKEYIDITLSKNGGDGAVREMVETILIRQNMLDKFIEIYTD